MHINNINPNVHFKGASISKTDAYFQGVFYGNTNKLISKTVAALNNASNKAGRDVIIKFSTPQDVINAYNIAAFDKKSEFLLGINTLFCEKIKNYSPENAKHNKKALEAFSTSVQKALRETSDKQSNSALNKLV